MWTLDRPIRQKPLGPGEPPRVEELKGRTPGGIPVLVRVGLPLEGETTSDAGSLRLHLEHARLRLLRGFEELLCLEGLRGVEHLPHQIETVRRVLRHFQGRVLLADEVGLGKTIEACLLLREYLLRGLVKRVLILTPPALVSQWQEELATKFDLQFAVAAGGAGAGADWWGRHDHVLASLSLAKSRKNFDAVTAQPWDLVIVDEAHHCKNRSTRNWELVNALRRRHLFLLTATPIQNDLVELYNLLTLLEPGHLKTERDFKKNYVRRGSPRDPRNRERLRSLLFEVMIRNTRSLVSIDLPPRYAQTFVVEPSADEARLYHLLETYLRWRLGSITQMKARAQDGEPEDAGENGADTVAEAGKTQPKATASAGDSDTVLPPLSRMQTNTFLLAAGSHPVTLVPMLERMARQDDRALALLECARRIGTSAKERKLVELLQQNREGKNLVFANFRATLARLASVLTEAGIPFSLFTGDETAAEKDKAVEELRTRVPVMLCSESGGEGRNLQFANTLINFDLPWNPMRIEQRVGRIHRIGQTREVFIFNLCTAGSLEERILRLLNDKIRMFELIVGEVGSILGNLEEGEEFESLVLDLWLRSKDGAELDAAFDRLGESLLDAHEQYGRSKELDDALFGEDYQ
ncbi:MAG TPA: SNF2-related protein [Planctomycetota bacterium]|nr:SNF2-related protein [Planctomycetota bacterium]